jgi:hypothetical protein
MTATLTRYVIPPPAKDARPWFERMAAIRRQYGGKFDEPTSVGSQRKY